MDQQARGPLEKGKPSRNFGRGNPSGEGNRLIEFFPEMFLDTNGKRLGVEALFIVILRDV